MPINTPPSKFPFPLPRNPSSLPRALLDVSGSAPDKNPRRQSPPDTCPPRTPLHRAARRPRSGLRGAEPGQIPPPPERPSSTTPSPAILALRAAEHPAVASYPAGLRLLPRIFPAVVSFSPESPSAGRPRAPPCGIRLPPPGIGSRRPPPSLPSSAPSPCRRPASPASRRELQRRCSLLRCSFFRNEHNSSGTNARPRALTVHAWT